MKKFIPEIINLRCYFYLKNSLLIFKSVFKLQDHYLYSIYQKINDFENLQKSRIFKHFIFTL